MRSFIRRIGKRGQSGQSLVILAIGFLALLGFVGIVTDVSVLFIRYSTMRRAVDAAAIAAAGQMRRVQDTMLNADGTGTADGQATSIANLNLAARQFIEVYGLNPTKVLVETCGTQDVARDVNGNAVDAAGIPLITDDPDNPGKKIENPLADEATRKRYFQLCTSDELKLVRVTAQIDAPTIFLQLLGYPTVTLTESAISQTAVIDVVLIFDVSESMVNETTYSDWDHIPSTSREPSPGYQGVYYMPPVVNPFANPYDPAGNVDGFAKIATLSQTDLNALIDPGSTPDPDLKDVTIAFEPTTASVDSALTATDWQVYTDAAHSSVGRVQPRVFCRVRGYTSTSVVAVVPDAALREAYQSFFNNVYTPGDSSDNYDAQFTIASGGSPKFLGFVPQYNYYGCCNDPNGDYVFDDLICQPFKDARDAAHGFLDRLDFLRGDRVGFVTFDRQAYMVDPDGADVTDPNTGDIIPGGPQGVMIETQTDIPDPDHAGQLLRKGADNVLDDVVGVKADGTGYVDISRDGLWDHLIDAGNGVTYEDLMDRRVGDITNNPVLQSCYFDNATINAGFMTPEQQQLPGGGTREFSSKLLSEIVTIPSWYFSAPYNGANFPYASYEYRAGCAGTNIGAALETGSLALYNEGRREGAVWIMVLLSDGAAGASNPITRYDAHDGSGSQEIAPADPYQVYEGTNYYAPQKGVNGPNTSPYITDAEGYGFFGLCPYGTADQPSQLLSNNGTNWFPFCMDLHPETRHFCGDVAIAPDFETGSILDADPNCFNYYNVDDYARDWADWVGVADLNTGNAVTTGRVTQQLLPTIFTIGFGINYDTEADTNYTVHTACAADDYNCIRGLVSTTGLSTAAKRTLRDRTADYLGEELLRYIADVGDNNQIDSDYWQLCESIGKDAALDPNYRPNCRDDGNPAPRNTENRIPNYIDLYSTAPNWGLRGACENEWPSTSSQALRGNVYDPKPPMTPCGNYFVAATGQQLEAVFDQIASRMFTRLSQ